MVGIYAIENMITREIYVGQSIDIERRIQNHISDSRRENPPSLISKMIKQYGVENFMFEILCECKVEELDYEERYYISVLDTVRDGYNISIGGKNNSGESNHKSKLTSQEVYNIREAYNNHTLKRSVYELYKNKITWYSFSNLWEGQSWTDVHMDVYTPENLLYYSKQATNGELSPKSKFTNQEVLELRKRYVNETAREIYEDYKDRCSYITLQQILWGRVYCDLPIYDKKHKVWINC